MRICGMWKPDEVRAIALWMLERHGRAALAEVLARAERHRAIGNEGAAADWLAVAKEIAALRPVPRGNGHDTS